MLYHASADLLVCEKLDAGVREDAEEGCGVAFEETADAIAVVDVANGFGEAGPVALVLCEVGVARLEEDFDTVEGADYCLALYFDVSLACRWHVFGVNHTAHPANPPASPLFSRYSGLRLSTFRDGPCPALAAISLPEDLYSGSAEYSSGFWSFVCADIVCAVVVMMPEDSNSSWRRAVVDMPGWSCSFWSPRHACAYLRCYWEDIENRGI